jgi:hypothetical protein
MSGELRDARYTPYVEMREAGVQAEEIYRRATEAGFGQIEAIRLIRVLFDMGLAEAKEVMIRALGLAPSLSEYQEQLVEPLQQAFEAEERVTRLEATLRMLFARQDELREQGDATRAERKRISDEVLRIQDEYCTSPEREEEYLNCLEKILGFNPSIDPKEIEEAMKNPFSMEDFIAELERMGRYRVRLMFEWGGGCLWCGNDTARERFGVGNIEDSLPLSSQTRQRLKELSAWHDQSLNWDYPPDPGPWTAEESERFEAAAREVLERIRCELGDEFEVVYERL